MKGLTLAIGTYATMLFLCSLGLGARRRPVPLTARPGPRRDDASASTSGAARSPPPWRAVFLGLARVPMAQAVALTFIAPLLALMLAALLLKEPVGRRSLLGSLAAAAGVDGDLRRPGAGRSRARGIARLGGACSPRRRSTPLISC